MRVALYEDNLMWSVRIKNGLRALGHEVVPQGEDPDLAIVDLGTSVGDPFDTVVQLKSRGVKVIGHVGHKDKELWRRGEEAGCEKVVSNGTMAKRLDAVLAGVA